MTSHITVWPDGLWVVFDELGSTIAKGTWNANGKKRAHVTVEAELPRASTKKNADEAHAWCVAVAGVVAAMMAHDA